LSDDFFCFFGGLQDSDNRDISTTAHLKCCSVHSHLEEMDVRIRVDCRSRRWVPLGLLLAERKTGVGRNFIKIQFSPFSRIREEKPTPWRKAIVDNKTLKLLVVMLLLLSTHPCLAGTPDVLASFSLYH
jgi:hypothetical protein